MPFMFKVEVETDIIYNVSYKIIEKQYDQRDGWYDATNTKKELFISLEKCMKRIRKLEESVNVSDIQLIKEEIIDYKNINEYRSSK